MTLESYQCSSAVPNNCQTAFTFDFPVVSPIVKSTVDERFQPAHLLRQHQNSYTDNSVFMSPSKRGPEILSETGTFIPRSGEVFGMVFNKHIMVLLLAFAAMAACVAFLSGTVTGAVVITSDQFATTMLLWFTSLVLLGSVLVVVWSVCQLVARNKYDTLDGSNIVFFPDYDSDTD